MSQRIKEAIILTASYYGQTISPEVLGMYVEDLAGFDEFQVLTAYKAYRQNAKNRLPPLPAQIIEILRPSPDDRLTAVEIARKIDKALGDHGYVWEGGYACKAGHFWEARVNGTTETFFSFKEAVLAEIGEVGWRVIQARGGWMRLHSSQRDMQEGQFFSQLRDLVQAEQFHCKSVIDAPRLEQRKTHVQLVKPEAAPEPEYAPIKDPEERERLVSEMLARLHEKTKGMVPG